MLKCGYCGAKLTRLTYQARSADEGSKVIDVCESCRLDMGKVMSIKELTTYKGPVPDIRLTSRPKPIRMKNVGLTELEISCGSTMAKTAYVFFSDPNRSWKDAGYTPFRISGTYKAKSSIVIYDGKEYSCMLRKRLIKDGGTEYVAKYNYKREGICPGVSLSISQEWKVEDYSLDDPIDDGSFTRYTVNYMNFVMSATKLNARSASLYSFEVEIPCENSMNLVIPKDKVMQALAIMYRFCKFDPSSFPIPGTLKQMIVRSKSTAYDGIIPLKEDDYVYVPKVDGERHIAIQFGSVWLFADSRCENVIGYKLATEFNFYRSYGWILDLEATMEGFLVLIDIFATDDGSVCRSARNYEFVYELGCTITQLKGLVVRNMCNTYKEAVVYAEELGLRYDGIMAVVKSGLVCIKIKDDIAIELNVTKTGGVMRLSSSAGKEFDVVTDHYRVRENSRHKDPFKVGSVVELRLKRIGNRIGNGYNGVVSHKITDIINRPDKRYGNGTDVVCDIIQSQENGHSVGRMMMRAITDTCFGVRDTCYDIAYKKASEFGRVLIDVGCGRGQFLPSIMEKGFDKIIFIEPDKKSVKQLMSQFGKMYELSEIDKHSIPTVLSGIKSRESYRIVFNCSFAEFSEISTLAKFDSYIGAIMCSFSFNYVFREVSMRKYDKKVVGSCYTYDEAVDGVLYSDNWISMVLDETGKSANVRWENDRYNEPALTRSEIQYNRFNLERVESKGYVVLNSLVIVKNF